MFALAPRASTLRLTHAVLSLAALILAGDLAYFYFTLEHVEPILFLNLNAQSVRGTLGLTGGLLGALGVGGALALVGLNARLLADARPALTRPIASVLLLAACLLPALPLLVATQPTMPHRERELEILNRNRNAYLEKVSAPILANFFKAVADSRHIEKAAPPTRAERYAPDEATALRELGLLDIDAPGPPQTAAALPEIRRIALVILESLPAAYLHAYNPAVPAEATPFLDSLLRRYPPSTASTPRTCPAIGG